jgi:hypothetical protein
MTVADANVHALRPYTDDQTLTFLQANGETKFSQAELAKRWKWSRRTVRQPEFSTGAIDHLTEAATANAHALREGGNLADAEHWDRLAAAAKAELAAR